MQDTSAMGADFYSPLPKEAQDLADQEALQVQGQAVSGGPDSENNDENQDRELQIIHEDFNYATEIFEQTAHLVEKERANRLGLVIKVMEFCALLDSDVI